MVTSPSFTSWPKKLTPSVIRKYFPSCSDCPLGNLAERPLPSSPKSNDIAIHSDRVVGEEFEIDLKGKYTAPDGKPIRSFDGSLYTFNGIDLASDYALLPSLPHRHNKTRRIERFHRSTSDLMMKQLANKAHLTPQYWSLSWQHAVDMRNILPRKRLLGKTPYEKWFGRPYDLVNIQLFPVVQWSSHIFHWINKQLSRDVLSRVLPSVHLLNLILDYEFLIRSPRENLFDIHIVIWEKMNRLPQLMF
jgi:hypothetical protein